MPTEEPCWAVVELMGHVRIAGRLSEEEKFGGKMGRLDIPQGPDGEYMTQYFTAGSVYRITVVTEEVARQIAKTSSDIAPVKPWEMPKMLLAKTGDIPFGDEDPTE